MDFEKVLEVKFKKEDLDFASLSTLTNMFLLTNSWFSFSYLDSLLRSRYTANVCVTEKVLAWKMMQVSQVKAVKPCLPCEDEEDFLRKGEYQKIMTQQLRTARIWGKSILKVLGESGFPFEEQEALFIVPASPPASQVV